MKLLFDQNISYRILKKIDSFFPDAQQTGGLNLSQSTDFEIWDFARINHFCIVTFDSDFIDISLLRGFPPKIIWLKFGNSSTDQIAGVLLKNQALIKEFLDSSDVAFLELR
jgi:predicted nuclease of predicted toxin-antitoxin system